MTILTCHELGHYFQNRRYGISATLPYFIPVPIPPLGTFGAIILMRGRAPNSRALFDVGISGPLAGLSHLVVKTGRNFVQIRANLLGEERTYHLLCETAEDAEKKDEE